MKNGKILFSIILTLAVAGKAFAQPAARIEMPSMEKTDPVKVVQAFPNPATEFLTVHFEQPQARKVKLTVYTIIGNTVEVETEIMDEFEIRIKVKDLSSGYYLLALNNPETSFKNTFKFLKR